MLRLSAVLLFVLVLPLIESHAQTPPEARGVWVHEHHYSDLDGTFRRLSEAGINIAYLRTWYQGRTVYPSDVVEAAGGQRQHTAFVGRDPIQEAIDVAEQYGISVAVWMEYGLVGHIAYATEDDCPEPSGIMAENPDWSMVDRDGKIATPSAGSNSLCFYWMDPAHPEVIAFMADMAGEIALRYPALDIYEADRFRYPSYHWSYSDVSVSRYMDETGNVDPRTTAVTDPEYITWRREQTTHLMGEVYRAVKSNNPSMAVSAAVAPPYMIGGSQEKMQYWPAWADSGYVDFLEVMLYLSDTSYPNQLSLARGLVGDDFPLYSGIDNSQGYDLVGQIEETRRQGVEGVIIWDGRSAIEGSDVELLGSGPFSEKVLPPHDDIRVDDADASAVFEGTWETIQDGADGSARVRPSGSTGSATYTLSPVRDGWYVVEGWWPVVEGAGSSVPMGITTTQEGGQMPVAVEVDQRQGEAWTRLFAAHLRHTDTLRVSVSASADGAVVTDVFRLRRQAAFRLLDALIVGPNELQLRFNRSLGIESVGDAQVSISGGDVEDVRLKQGDEAVLRVTTSELTPDATYDVDIRNIFAADGMPLAPISISLTADFSRTRILLDDGETGFNQQGTWAIEQGGGLDDGPLRTASAAAANRAYWVKSMPEDALYSVAVHLPEGTGERSASAAYLIIHREGTDTVRVDQRSHAGGWKELGVYRPRNGSQLYVQLMGDISSEGVIVADAVRWQRTLSPVDSPLVPAFEDVQVGAPYPNPTAGSVTIPVEHLPVLSEIRVSIHDVLGRQVMETDDVLTTGRGRIELNLSGLAAGHYFLRIAILAPGVGESRILVRQVAVVR